MSLPHRAQLTRLRAMRTRAEDTANGPMSFKVPGTSRRERLAHTLDAKARGVRAAAPLRMLPHWC